MAAATEEAPSEELPWELHPDKSIRFEAHGGLWEGAVERVEACHLASSGACIDAWGEFSAKCQGLRRPITSVELLRGPFADHAAFVVLEGSSARVVGIVKTGQKHLYLRDRKGGFVNGRILCLLDVCIHPRLRGRGVGFAAIQAVLATLGSSLERCAIDRPSAPMQRLLRSWFPEHFASVIEQDSKFWVSESAIESMRESK
jgi:GNAT superfamily N-acetyltransferase